MHYLCMSTDSYGNVIAQRSALVCLLRFLHSSTKLALQAEQPLALSATLHLQSSFYHSAVYAHITLKCVEKRGIKFACCFGKVSTNSLHQYLLKKGNLFGFYYFPQLECLYTFFKCSPSVYSPFFNLLRFLLIGCPSQI